MKKLLAALCSCLLFVLCAQAQDTIVKTNGEELRVKVIEVNEEFIKFQRIEKLNGSAEKIARVNVSVIKYANGLKEVISSGRAGSFVAPSLQDSLPVAEPRQAPPDQFITGEKGHYSYMGSRINIKKVIELIEDSGNPKAIMQIKIYKRVKRGGKALMITGISMASVGIPVFALSTLIKASIQTGQNGNEFFTGTQVIGALVGAGGIGCFIGGLSSKRQAAVILDQSIDTYNTGTRSLRH